MSVTRRETIALVLLAIVSAGIFFSSLERVWPLADFDVHQAPARVIPEARRFLLRQGVDVRRHAASSAVRVDAFSLDYVTRVLGMETAQGLIRTGAPLYVYEVVFKRHGDPDSVWVDWHPRRGVIGWGRTVQDDARGATVDVESARRIADAASSAWRGKDSVQRGHTLRDRPARRDHTFVYEAYLSKEPELRERIAVTVSGDRVTAVQRQLVPPESARRDARRREAPVAALQMTSFLFLGIAAIAALAIFLLGLQRGEILLGRSARWVLVITAFFVATQLLRPHVLLRDWDPLWPRGVAALQTIGFSLSQGAWIALVLFIVLAAGDAIDRRTGANRGASFWRAGAGHLFDPEVGVASARGFLVGLICGGALAASLLLIETFAGGWSGIQPQGFFFFAINSSVPALSTLLYFLLVAMVEESAYRFFAGSWLLSLTGKRWIAIVVPGVLYGASHTGLDFLPPVEPFWGRAIALSVVGCVWGWAFFRYGALTVILSHFTADLFIFNWPRLGSGDPVLMTKALLTMLVPLIPALLMLIPRRTTRPA
jgi:hypothetical protein